MKNRNEKWQPQWVALPIIDFVRVVHGFGDDSVSALEWMQKFANDLLFCNFDTNDEFAKGLLMDAKEKYTRRSNAGKLGGRPSGNRDGAPRNLPKTAGALPTTQQLYDFARAEGLDEADARDWYEMSVTDRGGLTRNGEKIKNWKGACKRFCRARLTARNRQGES